MAFTADPTTSIGRVRLLISDFVETGAIFPDDSSIQAFIDLAIDNNVRRAAAMALRSMAANEIMVQKVIRLLDLSTNGAAQARELRLLAATYEEQADLEDLSKSPFEIGEWINDDFSEREFLHKEALRNQVV